MKKEQVLARLKEDCLVAVVRAKNLEQGEKLMPPATIESITFSLSCASSVQSCIVPAFPKLMHPMQSFDTSISVFPSFAYSMYNPSCNPKCFYFNLPYSSSVTGSHHSLDVSSPGTSTARWLNQLSGAAPCQCLTSAGILIQSPGFNSTASLPSS